jgi:hypothetical protein
MLLTTLICAALVAPITHGLVTRRGSRLSNSRGIIEQAPRNTPWQIPVVSSSQVATITKFPTDVQLGRKARKSRRQDGVILQIPSGSSWLTDVDIGGQTFQLMVDTGSSETWVTAPNCTCSGPCGFNNQLDVPGDENWISPFSTQYGSASGPTVDGGLINRPLSVAGIFIPEQTVGLVTSVSGDSGDAVQTPEDGILGLGPIGGTDPQTSPVFNSMWGGLIQPNVFMLALTGTTDNNAPESGLLAFGGTPASVQLTSDWASAPILAGHWYKFQVDTYQFDGSDSIILTPDENTVVIDSGTTFTYLPPVVADALLALYPGTPAQECTGDPNERCTDSNGEIKVPCDGVFPSFAVQIGGISFAVSPDDMIQNTGQYCRSAFKPQIGSNNGPPLYILGENFMRNVIVAYDYIDQSAPLMHVATYTSSL